MGLVAAFVNNPVKVSVGVLLTAIFGVLAIWQLPVQLVPEVQRPVITVTTPWPGASPQEVEREIVNEQEEQLKGVEGVLKMSSESANSRALVSLEFEVGVDIAEALLKVNTRLQQVPEYPEDALEPVLSTSGAEDQAIAWLILRPSTKSEDELRAWQTEHPELAAAVEPALRAASSGLRERRLELAATNHPEVEELLPQSIRVEEERRFAEDRIEARLERIEGVSNVNVYGGRQEELQIVLNPRRLAARKITIQQLRVALGVRNHDISAGDYWEGKRRYVVRTLGQFRSPDEVADVVVSRRDGVPVYVRDVADVRMGFRKPEGEVFNFGRQCLAINVIRSTGANVLTTMEGVRASVERLNEGVLADHGLYLEQVYDETEYINSAIGLVKQNIAIGGVLTFLVLLLFLRSLGSTIVVSLAIPTSIVGTFMLLGLLGRSLNVISLAGLAFAVGMLVDNAIVVLENIYRRYQEGERRLEAAVQGAQEVWGAVIASTLTTLAVFVPILFLKGEIGQLFGDIAVAISCAVALSLLVSVTVIPTATARILPKRNRHAETGEITGLASETHLPWLLRPFRALFRLISRILRPLLVPIDLAASAFSGAILGVHRWLQGGVVRQLVLVVAILAGVWFTLLPLIPEREYLPKGNQNLVMAFVLPPPGYNLAEMSALGEIVDARLMPFWNADPDDPETAKLPFPSIRQYFFVAFGNMIFAGTSAHDPMRAEDLVPLMFSAGHGIPGAIAFAQQASIFERGTSASRSIDIEIRGPDLRTLTGIGQQVFGMVQQHPVLSGGQSRPVPSLDLSSPEVHVLPRWEKAADLGVSGFDLGYSVNAFVDGAYAGDYFTGGDKIDLRIVGEERYASRLQDLKDLPIATPTGNLVPLSAVADIELSSGPEQINRRERERTITVLMEPPKDVALEAAVGMVERDIIAPLKAQGALGGDYHITLGGTADKLKRTTEQLGTNLLLAVLITFLLMAALFESWLYPFIVILSVPLGAVGGLAGLWVLNFTTHQPLDTLTMIGFIILIGTVVNNAILIVHQALNGMRYEKLDPSAAVLKSVRTRIRPIFMTLFTTVFGLSPLVLAPGAGSELYRGIGSILIGGLVVSTFFTLLLVPTLFRLMVGARTAIAGVFRGD